MTASRLHTPRFTVGRSDITVNGQKDIVTSGMSNVNDVFVYDTTKDSDGGKWRNDEKSQGQLVVQRGVGLMNRAIPCSNTDDRCGRREFPEKAILVATTTDVYIFDAKDNSMWMDFNASSSGSDIGRDEGSRAVYALNGRIYFAN